jgi:hypothetical protein
MSGREVVISGREVGAATGIGSPLRLRLRTGVHVAPVDTGLAFLGWSQSFVLTGRDVGALRAIWRAAAPALEAGVDPQQLVDAAPTDGVRQLLRQLLAQLAEHQMLVVVKPGDLPPEEAERFADLLSYLDAVAEDPVAALRALRAARVAVFAPGDLTMSAVRTLVRAGIGTVGVLPGSLDRPRLAAYLPAPLDTTTIVEVVDDGSWQVVISMASSAEGAGLAVDGSTEPAALAGGPVRLEVALGAAAAGVARVRCIDDPHSGLEPGWAARLGAATGEPSPVLVALVGGLAAHQAVTHLAGLPTHVTGRSALLVDGADLATTTHLVPVPADPGWVDATPSPLVLPPLILAPVTTAEDVLAGTQALTDDVFGLLRAPHPLALTQVPLALASCGVVGGRDVSGAAETGAWARVDALLAAVRNLPPPLSDRAAKAYSPHDAATVMLAPPQWVVAAGTTPAGLIADALARALVADLDDVADPSDLPTTHGGSAGMTIEPYRPQAGDDAQAWRWLKTLVVRWGLPVTVFRFRLAGLPTWHVIAVHTGTERAYAVGPDLLGTVRAALGRACAVAQAARDPAGPPDPDPVVAADAAPAELMDALGTLANAGRRLALLACPGAAAIADAGIWVGYAGLGHA